MAQGMFTYGPEGIIDISGRNAQQLALLYLGFIAQPQEKSGALFRIAQDEAARQQPPEPLDVRQPLDVLDLKQEAKAGLTVALGDLCNADPLYAFDIANETKASQAVHERLLSVMLFGTLHAHSERYSPEQLGTPLEQGILWEGFLSDNAAEVQVSADNTVGVVLNGLERAIAAGRTPGLAPRFSYINLARLSAEDSALPTPSSFADR